MQMLNPYRKAFIHSVIFISYANAILDQQICDVILKRMAWKTLECVDFSDGRFVLFVVFLGCYLGGVF